MAQKKETTLLNLNLTAQRRQFSHGRNAIRGVLPASFWEHAPRIDAEEIECLPLRRGRDQLEAFGGTDGDVVQHDGREIGEQGVEAVHGRRGRSAFACGLAWGGRRWLGGFNRRGALRPGGLRIVLFEQDRGELLFHVPFDIVGGHAQEDMGFGVDEDRPDSQTPGLDLPEDLLDLRAFFTKFDPL